jgi:hypothetical protein
MWRRAVNEAAAGGPPPAVRVPSPDRHGLAGWYEQPPGPLAALAARQGDSALFLSDLWGLSTHFWSGRGECVAVSNRSCWVAQAVQAPLSQGAVHQALFFGAPCDLSWFEGVEVLPGGSALVVDSTGDVRATRICTPRSAMTRRSTASFTDFFQRFFDAYGQGLSGPALVLACSDGWEVKALLGGLAKAGVQPGKSRNAECGMRPALSEAGGGVEGLVELERVWDRAIAETDGLLPPRQFHRLRRYDDAPAGATLFDGEPGRELVEGVLSAEAGTLGACHEAVIRDGLSVADALLGRHPELPPDFAAQAAGHIESRFGGILEPRRGESGFAALCDHVLDNLAARALARAALATGRRCSLAVPFLEPGFLSALHAAGYGMLNAFGSDQESCSRPATVTPVALLLRSLGVDAHGGPSPFGAGRCGTAPKAPAQAFGREASAELTPLPLLPILVTGKTGEPLLSLHHLLQALSRRLASL